MKKISLGPKIPRRVTLSRKRGWRKPANTVVVSRPTKWGNPFPTAQWRSGKVAVGDYERWLRATAAGKRIAGMARAELRGKNLACWCAQGEPCHADVLLRVANGAARGRRAQAVRRRSRRAA